MYFLITMKHLSEIFFILLLFDFFYIQVVSLKSNISFKRDKHGNNTIKKIQLNKLIKYVF